MSTVSVKFKVRLALLVMTLWITGSLWLLWSYSTPEFGTFDPEQRLPRLSEHLASKPAWLGAASNPSQLVLITQDTCSCRQDAMSHVTRLQQQSQVELTVLDLSALPAELQQHIPATPLLLWWQGSRLSYAGPAATGPWCSFDTDIVLPLLQGTMQLPGVWLNGQTSSCRCLTR